jgi:hypothetical protein
MNPMPLKDLLNMRAGIKSVRDKDESVESEAARKLYRAGDYGGNDGLLGIPRVNLFACLCEAGRQIDFRGKTKISTATSTFLPMIVSFEEGRRFFAFDKQDIAYTTDVVKGTNPNGGEAVAIVRPAFEDWTITLEVEIDESTGVKDKTIFQLFKLAGAGIGLCDHRPNKKGECGRFKVVAWETVRERDNADDAAKFFGNESRKKVTRRDQIAQAADAADAEAADVAEPVGAEV